jgi:hypothetical protein
MTTGGWRMRLRALVGPERIVLKEPEDLLEATLELAQTQLIAQIADETSTDGRTMGVLAFIGALLAADIAAKDVLGRWWWTLLVAVGLATFPCLRSTFGKDTDLGPPALTFYATYGGHTSKRAREQLLADLDASFQINATRVKVKRRRLRWAVGIISVGLVVASLLIGLDTPTTIKTMAKTGNQQPRPLPPAPVPVPGPSQLPHVSPSGLITK